MCLDEVLLHEYTRICHRPSDHFLRLLVCDLLGNTVYLNHRVLSPIHILKLALRQADFDEDLFQRVEPAPVMSLSRLKSDIPAIHWGPENLGSSKTQTTTQAAAARVHTINIRGHFHRSTYYLYGQVSPGQPRPLRGCCSLLPGRPHL